MTDTMEAQAEMPRYVCHKEVWALKISAVERPPNGSAIIYPEDIRYSPIPVSTAFATKHDPQPGGYYVVYKDGYKSFSPAKAFEDGYTFVK